MVAKSGHSYTIPFVFLFTFTFACIFIFMFMYTVTFVFVCIFAKHHSYTGFVFEQCMEIRFLGCNCLFHISCW